MKNFVNTVVKVINQNKIALISAFLVVAVIGVPAYAHQVRQSNQEKYYKEQQAKLEELKKQETLAVKPADTPAPTPEAKPEDVPAPTQAPVPKKTYTATTEKTYTKPPEDKPTPVKQTVSVTTTASQSGAIINVNVAIGSDKAGYCQIFLKDIITYTMKASITVPSSSGACHTSFPITGLSTGTYWAKAYFTSNDSLTSGFGYTEFGVSI